jgi:predicted nucleic acid-binding Zn ribbon protein
MDNGRRSVPRTCKQCGERFTDTRVGRSAPLSYCTPLCRQSARVQQLAAARANYGPCSVPDCADRVRSANAEWCEMHYTRYRRHGNDRSKYRSPNGTCYQCGASLEVKTLFCSASCRRRDRMGVSGANSECVVCNNALDPEAHLRVAYCSNACTTVATRARLYNVSIEHMRALSAESTCAICGDTTSLVVDHDHDTGQIRGMLCTMCNTGLGMFRDSPKRLAAAVGYLQGGGRELGDIEQEESTAA